MDTTTTTATLNVRVLHSPQLGWLDDEDFYAVPLADAGTYPINLDLHAAIEARRQVLHRMFAACNGHPGPDDGPVSDAYYNGHRRSMCVGDVLVLGETAWRCEPAGWQAVDLARFTIATPGTVHDVYGDPRRRVVAVDGNGWRIAR